MNATRPISPFLPPQPIEASATLAQGGRPTLRQAAGEVETMFLSLLLKEMRQSLDDEGGLFAGDSGDVYGGLFDFYMSQHLTAAGGIGLAATWAKQLEANQPSEPTHDAPNDRNTRQGVPQPPSP